MDGEDFIPEDQFVDLIAVAQSCPGVLAANISVFVGYKMRKTPGALVTCLGAILPSFLIILGIALFFHQFMDHPMGGSNVPRNTPLQWLP